MRTRRIGIGVVVVATASVIATTSGLATAEPAPPGVAPSIEVFLADGTPADGGTVRVGDTITVRGHGFDPEANRDGLPLPVPPGVPHGVFVTYGAFAPQWRPSEGAPSSARVEQRSNTVWVMDEDALNAVPSAPFDFRRTIGQQWVPFGDDGTFTATIEVAEIDGAAEDARYGVYSYAGAGAVNAAEEHFVPVDFDPSPGPNTPQPPAADLTWAFAPGFADLVKGELQGGLAVSDGASLTDDGRLTFELASSDIDGETGLGIARYAGTAVAYTKFHLAEIAIVDPWIEFTREGTFLSAETSTTSQNGTDATARSRLARLDAAPDAAGGERTDVPARFEHLSPQILAPYLLGSAAPVSFRY
ncbi:hypothetical protein DW322_06965 [Rhodococcus rhodnii]|uniref:Htaa domain-containing protein n=2 Tax=Rhodococcus rhodnii TaxID=38312 RepID=R7WLZ3_9NOCA|nr:HtaA domain-containing protein [Rhodococcus rhodnii]EOM76331.1 hypothetical protein Rrhod_2332 [Rhodococcus rhodnii LMG 5362]TXG90001.1 hypothetical protein DW322_06965 [Rhodococcus rhodnii]